MPDAPKPLARRTVVIAETLPPELAQALSAAGLEVRPGGDPSAPDVLLAEPGAVAGGGTQGIEVLIASRAGLLLAKLGDTVPALHEAVMGQAERGLFRAVLEHTGNHMGRAAKILGLDRNTCARKARSFGLVSEPSRGRKPSANKAGGAIKKPSAARTRAEKRPR